MAQLEWLYHRKNCKTCTRSNAYLLVKGHKVQTVVDCKTQPMTLTDAKQLLKGAKKLYATKGTKVVELDLETKPDDDTLIALMIGPSGNLRAPTIKHGEVVVIGYNDAMYDAALSS